MPEPQRIVIIGSGLAGAKAAGELVEGGYSGELTVLGSEQHFPYELPALSKGILLGEQDQPDWVHDSGFYAERGIDLRLGTTASRIELGARSVLDADSNEYNYDRLLLATGSSPRSIPVPGSALAGVRTLRTLDDAFALRSALRESRNVVVIGAGWIGTEAAAAARRHDADVTVVDRISEPLETVLGGGVSAVFRDLHAERGVKWRLGTEVAEIVGGEDGVTGVRLTDGTQLPADTVLIAVGAAPRVDLAHAAGLELSDSGGVSVDAGLRTSAPDVYAIGDIAAQFHPAYGTRLRVEHWANAKGQGEHVAKNLLGGHEPYLASPFFFSDQYDVGLEYRGLADPDSDRIVIRGELAAREFIAFWLRGEKISAAMNVNVWDHGDALQRLVDGDFVVDDQMLTHGDLSSVG